ncbi:MAG: TPM domain-containing protein [Spirochaetales bacterium]|nr:TPM domain-containing protein [Spirochaetales bacterium]
MKFNSSDLTRIRDAAGKAEKTTSGEIASAMISESSDYAYYELMFSLLVGIVYFGVMMFFHPAVETWLNGIFWGGVTWQVSGFYGLSTLIVVGLIYVLANIPGFDRLIVPRSVMGRTVYRRALVHFMASGLYNTRDRTGILIFLSLKERRVELIADQGINDKVDQSAWDSILGDLLESLKSGTEADGLVNAITACGKILTEYFPVKPDDTNELPDGLVFLED